jgi:hypothetical protein
MSLPRNASCGVVTVTSNTAPTITTSPTHTIPRLTPFALSAVASDIDGDQISYIWEQFDLGPAMTSTVLEDTGSGPIFRNFGPSNNPTRVFPSLRYILNNANMVPNNAPLAGSTSPSYLAGEILPSTARTLRFRVTARDNRAGGGGVADASTVVTVVNTAGPFAVTAPNTATSVAAGSSLTVTWNVAATDIAPINTSQVEIALSTDGGYSFPISLAPSTPNDGSQVVTLPANTPATPQARIRVAAVGSIYFDISDVNFTITNASSASPTLQITGGVRTTQGGAATSAAVAQVSDAQTAAGSLAVSVSQLPQGLAVSASNSGGNVSLSATAACSVLAPSGRNQNYPVLLTVSDGAGGTSSATVNVVVDANAKPSLGAYPNAVLVRGNSTSVAPSAAVSDANNNIVSVAVSPGFLPGSGAGANVSIASNGTVTVRTDANTQYGAYIVRIEVRDSCGALSIREFTVQVIPTGAVLRYAGSQIPNGNGTIDRNECNDLNVSLANIGNMAATTINTRLWSGTLGVIVVQPDASFPNLSTAQTSAASSPFRISTASNFVCGAEARFTLVATHGGGNSPTVLPFSLPTGTPLTLLDERFDNVAPPALPVGWITEQTGSAPPALWATASAPTLTAYTAPNAAFTSGKDSVATNSLVSPAIALPASTEGASVSIRHAWEFQYSRDGGVLELSTDGGTSFNDIVSSAVGGTFLAFGYVQPIPTNLGSPIGGRNAWSGSQLSYVESLVQLPPSLNGRSIRLRLRGAWDNQGVAGGVNWRVDGVKVVSGRACASGGSGVCAAPQLLNVDASSAPDVYSGVSDGALLLRYLFGLRDSALTNGISSTNAQRNAAQIALHIDSNRARFDVDGDGQVRATTDGLMILRRLLGLSGTSLTAELRVGTRTDTEIENAIDALRP